MSTVNIKQNAERATGEVEEIISNLVAIHEHEGITPSPDAIAYSKKVLKNEMSADDAVASIIAK